MTLPRSFKSWAVVGGRVRAVGVEVTNGEVSEVYFADAVNPEDCGIPDKHSEATRAWSVKALAWLKAEAGKNSPEVVAMLAAIDRLRDAQRAMEAASLNHSISTLSARARSVWREIPDSVEVSESLHEGWMFDLVDRCAEEMRRQAEAAVAESWESKPENAWRGGGVP